jgi:3-phenylpropionate/cinnamic acid dioxygenase small subunit
MDAASSTAPGIDRSAFEEFLFHEAALLDARRFRDWMALFSDDGTYWVPAVPDQLSPFDQASLFYDDIELMKTRVDRLEHPLIHVQTPPSRTAHLVGNIIVEQADAPKGEFVVGSTVIMVEYRDEAQRVFAGRQHHRLRLVGAGFRIVQKRVDLINCDSAFEAIAVPI